MAQSAEAALAAEPGMVLVDTPVWSLALRRERGDLNARERIVTGALAELIREGTAQIAGAVRQESLSGIREPQRFEKLRQDLRPFDDAQLEATDYEEAGRMHNRCRSPGARDRPLIFYSARWRIAVAGRFSRPTTTSMGGCNSADRPRPGRATHPPAAGFPLDEPPGTSFSSCSSRPAWPQCWHEGRSLATGRKSQGSVGLRNKEWEILAEREGFEPSIQVLARITV
jgi:hypothetical protein